MEYARQLLDRIRFVMRFERDAADQIMDQAVGRSSRKVKPP